MNENRPWGKVKTEQFTVVNLCREQDFLDTRYGTIGTEAEVFIHRCCDFKSIVQSIQGAWKLDPDSLSSIDASMKD